jgi:hypothetical protein
MIDTSVLAKSIMGQREYIQTAASPPPVGKAPAGEGESTRET